MGNATCIVLAAAVTLQALASAGLADTYYPYQSYDEYHRKHTSPQPPPTPPPPPQNLPRPEVKPPLQSEPPLTLTQPPEFLFPAPLGFGVAIGIPYDLFYHSKSYYSVKGGNWYRAPSYKGPWQLVGLSRVPEQLRKHDLKEIRELRNKEFQDFWKNRDHYKGRYFRPEDGERTAPLKPAPPKAK